MNRFVFITRNGNFIGVDSNSGGYPYVTNHINQVHMWGSTQEAFKYEMMFTRSTGLQLEMPWKLRRVTGLKLEDI